MSNSQNNSSDENWRDAMCSAMTYDWGCLNMYQTCNKIIEEVGKYFFERSIEK